MYALLLLVGVHSVYQEHQADLWRASYIADAHALDLGGKQRMHSQRIAWLATQLAGPPTQPPGVNEAFRQALAQAGAEAAALAGALRPLLTGHPDQVRPLREAVAQWEGARLRLWDAAQALSVAAEQGRAVEPWVRPVLQAADPALGAAQMLVDELERRQQERQRDALQASRTWTVTTALLVLLLIVAVVEPTVAFVKAQYRRLNAQTHELARLAMVAEHTTNAVMVADEQRRIVWVNQAFTRISGYASGTVLGKGADTLLLHEVVDAHAVSTILTALDQQQGVHLPLLAKRQDGGDLWWDLDIQPVQMAGGALSGYVVVAADATQRRQALQELRVSAIAFDTSEAMAITDAQERILKVNPAFARVTGFSAEEAVGTKVGHLLQSGRHDAAFYRALHQGLRDKHRWEGEIWNRRKSGEVYPEQLSITAVRDEQDEVTHYVAVFSDITQRKQAEQSIHNLAYYDPLTELPNRRLMLDRLHQAQLSSQRSRRCAALMFIDLDHFKQLNDSLGHDIGDLLLVEVAHRLRACVRAVDTVARQGGDEFVVILVDLALAAEQATQQALAVANKIQQSLARPFDLGPHRHHLTLSLGVTMFGPEPQTADAILKQADLAMYEAKHAGRNTCRVAAGAPGHPRCAGDGV
jgi:diguanylate cyclase (GGDEF)-like protein/PAS domain S-box-containing protein